MDQPADGLNPTQSLTPKGQIAIEPASRPRLPERIGGFGIQSLLAPGGMGIVYVAVQDKPRRTVALKVMRRGITSPETLRRFEYESQILARLRHPNVAQVIESGTHDDGSGSVPYFAMEYVPGARHLDEYARKEKLGVRERLELFARVCDGVHHAHQKAIIHRDLKPRNILVDSSGEPKIIDFGVARGSDADTAETAAQTKIGQLVGTLAYMSPEQVDGDPNDLDVRSDVYALGVILYELLCERPPYDVDTVSIVIAARTIRQTPPSPPASVRPGLRGDIETVMMKALEKSRQRRYQSAAELAEDVRRYLANKPILGRRATLVYRFTSLLRRHPRTTIVAGVAVAFMLGLLWNLMSTFLIMRQQSACIAEAAPFLNQRDSRDSKKLLRFVESPEHGGYPVLVLLTPTHTGDRLLVFDPQPRELAIEMTVPRAVSLEFEGTRSRILAGATIADNWLDRYRRRRHVIVTLDATHHYPAAMVLRDFDLEPLATVWSPGHIISAHWDAESGLLLASAWSNSLGDVLPEIGGSFVKLQQHHDDKNHKDDINPAVVVAIRLDTIAPGSETVLFPRVGDDGIPMTQIEWILVRRPNLAIELEEFGAGRLTLYSVEPPSNPGAVAKVRVRWQVDYEDDVNDANARYFETHVSADGAIDDWTLIDSNGETMPEDVTPPVLDRLDWNEVQGHAQRLRAEQPDDKP